MWYWFWFEYHFVFEVTDMIGFIFAPAGLREQVNYSVNSVHSWLAENGI